MSSATFADALREIRPRIANGINIYICAALCKTDNGSFREKITEQLDGYLTYSDWVGGQHPKAYEKMTHADFRAGRLQWIDHMIAKEETK